MKSNFPQENKVFLQTNRSNIVGNLWSTKNLDFQSNVGAIRLAQKLVANTTSASVATLGRPGAFARFDGLIFAVCGARVLVNSANNTTSAFALDASTGVPTDCDPDVSDLAVFDARLWLTANGSIYSKVGNGSGTGAWTSRASNSTADNQKLLYFKKTNLLYQFIDSQNIASWTAANVNNAPSNGDPNTLNIGNSIVAMTTYVANTSSIWIGTMVPQFNNSHNTFGSIIQWDGISPQITNEYPVQAAAVLAMTVLEDIPYAMDSEGRLLKYNGYSFAEVARLPINRTLLTNATYLGNFQVPYNGRFIHANGLTATKNNSILALVNNLNEDSGQTITESLPSGIWECDLESKSFTHRYGFTLSTLASATVTDFGQNRIVGSGALMLNTDARSSTAGRGTILAGAKIYTNASDTLSGIFTDSPDDPTTDNEGQKRGYFVTTFVESKDAEESWGRIWAMFRKFQAATDNIVFKFRTSEETPVEATITWVNTTTFTTSTDVSAYGPTATGFDGHTGGEVEITQGTGSGATPHITNISVNGGTYTVTLDEPVTGVTTGTAKARFQKWVRIGDVYAVTQQTKSWSQLSISNANDYRIQIKCSMAWTGNGEFYRMVIWSNTNKIITN